MQKILKDLRGRRRMAGVVVVLAVLIGGYYGVRALAGNNNGQLKASGTIETVNVDVSPELAGKVQAVNVDEGQSVKAGEALLVLDDTLLLEQIKASSAGLDSAQAASMTAENALNIAQAQYQQTLMSALAADKQSRLADWFSTQKEFDQPNWYFTRLEETQAAQGQVDVAQKALADAQGKLDGLKQSLGASEYLAAEQRLLNARVAYQVGKDVNDQAQNSVSAVNPVGLYNKTHCGTNEGYQLATGRLTNLQYPCSEDKQLAAAGTALYNTAQDELVNAQNAYDKLLTTQAAQDVLAARAEISVAQERYYAALDRLHSLQVGDQSPSVTAAQGAVDQAQAAYDQSQKAVAEAQANLGLLNAQLAKLTVVAPLDGVILSRNVEPGEYVQPGAAALTMGNISQLTITVYVPEDRYGQIHLGQQASVSVDSFPGEQFSGQVSYISDQAEFTPRNVQTVEGRSSTVYAVKLKVTDPQGKLKPGMPADVIFAQ